MKLTTKQKEILNILIMYIEEHISKDNTLPHPSSNTLNPDLCINGICQLLGVCVNTHLIHDTTPYSIEKFIDILYRYTPRNETRYGRWFNIGDFRIRLAFLKYVRFMSRFGIVIRFNTRFNTRLYYILYIFKNKIYNEKSY